MAKFLGGLLVAVGALMATLSGLCTLTVMAGMLAPLSRAGPHPGIGSSLGMLWLPLVFGGLPFALGVGLVLGGLAILRPSRPPPKPQTFD